MRISLKDHINEWTEVYKNSANAEVVQNVTKLLGITERSRQRWNKRISDLEGYVSTNALTLTAGDKSYISIVLNEVRDYYAKNGNIYYGSEIEAGLNKIQNKLTKTVTELEADAFAEKYPQLALASWFEQQTGFTHFSTLRRWSEQQQIGSTDLETLRKQREESEKELIRNSTKYKEQTGFFERVRGYAHKKAIAGILIGGTIIASFGVLLLTGALMRSNTDLQQKNKSQCEQIKKFGTEKASLEESVNGLRAEIADKNKGIEALNKLIGVYSESQEGLTSKLDDCTNSLSDCYKSKRGLQAEMEKLKGRITATKYKEQLTAKPVDTTKEEREIKETKILETPEPQKLQEQQKPIQVIKQDTFQITQMNCFSNKHAGNKGILVEGKMYYPDCTCSEPALYSGCKEGSPSRFAYQR